MSEEDEVQQYKELAQRIQAEFANYKKKAAERVGGEVDQALGKLVVDLLPVLDALEAAVGRGVEGAVEVQRAAEAVLGQHGLERICVLGEEFDPSVAEAVVASEGSEVLVEHRCGYLWRGRLLRAALVEVGRREGPDGA